MHRGACGRMTAARRRRAAPGSVGLRPPSPGARPTAPTAPALGGSADGGHQVRTIDEGPVRTQDTKSRGHQNQSGTILVWPSNCLNEPDHLSPLPVHSTHRDLGYAGIPQCAIGVFKPEIAQTGDARRSVDPRDTNLIGSSLPRCLEDAAVLKVVCVGEIIVLERNRMVRGASHRDCAPSASTHSATALVAVSSSAGAAYSPPRACRRSRQTRTP